MARTPDGDASFVRRERSARTRAPAEPGRHRARRSAMHVLYRADLVEHDVGDELAGFQEQHGFPVPAYTAELVGGVVERMDEVDAELSARLHSWSLERLGAVERSVLRIGMYELLVGAVPIEVAIDEAIELARRYASPDAAKLVNGVLGAWAREQQEETP